MPRMGLANIFLTRMNPDQHLASSTQSGSDDSVPHGVWFACRNGRLIISTLTPGQLVERAQERMSICLVAACGMGVLSFVLYKHGRWLRSRPAARPKSCWSCSRLSAAISDV